MKFSSIDDFYSFVELVRQKLALEGFPGDSKRLFSILHDGWSSSSSEILGEIRLTLQKIVERNRGKVSDALSKDIKIIIVTINYLFKKANGA